MAGNTDYVLQLIGQIDSKKTEKSVMDAIKKIEASLAGKDSGKIDVDLKIKQSGDQFIKIAKTTQDSYGNLIKQTDRFKISTDKGAVALDNTTKYLTDTTRAASSFSAEMGAVIRRTLESAATLGLMYGALNQLRQGVQYIKDLDKELTNVQIATGMTKDETYELASQYNQMASELGTTTIAVSQSATLFLKQGKTVEETGKLIKSSLMLSKLGMLENAQASEYLTTILNGYKISVDEANNVVSKMIAVDNASAASVSGMAEALSKTSSVARDSGVELSNLIAYIATVQTVTGQTGEVVGQAFDKIEALWYNK